MTATRSPAAVIDRRPRDYAARMGTDVSLAPGLIAALLRAARGECVQIGGVIFNPAVDPRRGGGA